MRVARIKIDPSVGHAAYHCRCRCINKEHLFTLEAKEYFRKLLWQVAEFTGIDLITYSILSNHFHLLAQVPLRTLISDEELLRRYAILHPRLTKLQAFRLEIIKSQMPFNGPDAVAWRRQQLALMGDISQFMKLLKQRFTRWCNRTYGRVGTFWSERFKSTLIEPDSPAVSIVAAYVDLNPLRAGLTEDPKDYRFCGYAEAVSGNRRARRGLYLIEGPVPCAQALIQYRERLFATGSKPRAGAAVISPERFAEAMRGGGKLSLPEVLRCRVRYFTDGLVLGSHAFVTTQLNRYIAKYGPRRDRMPKPLLPIADWGDLTTLRRPRGDPIG